MEVVRVVHECPLDLSEDLLALVPADLRELINATKGCAVLVTASSSKNPQWCWTFSELKRVKKYPQFFTVLCLTRGAWDEVRYVYYDTAEREYVLSIGGYMQEFTPDTIVGRGKTLVEVMKRT